MVLVRIFRFFVICLVIAQLILPQRAAMPGWWTDDSAQTRIIAPGATASNLAPANLGQLKYVATQAKKYLDQRLAAVGGAGAEINTLVAGFEPHAGQNYSQEQLAAFRATNYAPINVGQLKAVAKPFYKRLLAVGYNSRFNLLAHGAPAGWAYDYPWDPTQPWNQPGGDKTPNYQMANLAQLKMAFSFDLASDTDGNFLPAGLVGSTEGSMSTPNAAPGRLRNGGNTVSPPSYGAPDPGGGGAGPQTDPGHDATKPDAMTVPWLTVSAAQSESDMAHLDWGIARGVAVSDVSVQRSDGVNNWIDLGDEGNGSYDDPTPLLANVVHLYRLLVTFPNGEQLYSGTVQYVVPLVLDTPVSLSGIDWSNPGIIQWATPDDPNPTQDPHYYLTIHDHSESSDAEAKTSGVYDVSQTLDPVTGQTKWSGYSSSTDSNGVTQTASMNADGTWANASGQPPFTGGVGVAFMAVVSSTKMLTPGDGPDFTYETKEDEYVPIDFFADAIENMSPFDLFTHPAPTSPIFWPPSFNPNGDTLLYRYHSPNNDYVELQSGQYKVELNPSSSYNLVYYHIFVPMDPDNGGMGDAVAVGQQSIICNSSGDDAGPFTIDVTAKPDDWAPGGQSGYYYFAQAMQVSALGSVLDNSQPGGLIGATLSGADLGTGIIVVSPPDKNDKHERGASVSVNAPNIPGASYTVSISNASDFIVTDASGDRLSGSQPLTASDIASLTVEVSSSAQDGEFLTITITENISGADPVATRILMVNRTAAGKDLSVPLDEASGSRYRKIGLNGRPLADEKPQQTAESDEEKEETYVDALTLGLHHATTDVYVPIPGWDLPLTARRDTLSEVWNMKSGLRPHERFDRPFGAGWTSNLCAHEEVVAGEYGAVYTYVVDQNGARHRFALVTNPADSQSYYVPVPSDSRENSDYLTTLSSDGTVFTDRYGTKITFDLSHQVVQQIADDRYRQSDTTTTVFCGVSQISDRYGNTFVYSYPDGATTLIPKTIKITFASGVSQTLSIKQDGNGHITNIWDPNGNQFTYTYDDKQYTYNGNGYTETVLTSVTGPDGNVTSYGYAFAWEADQTPADIKNGQPVDKAHLDLSSITDPNGNRYAFVYGFDQTRFTYNTIDGYYPQTGAPSCVTTVTLPAPWGQATFSNSGSKTALQLTLDAQGNMRLTDDSARITTVRDGAGKKITYAWSGSQVFNMGSLTSADPPPKVVFYTTMKVSYEGYGQESFTFDPTAGLALKSVTDFSGNSTSYTYADLYSSAPAAAIYALVFPWAGFATAYPDPTQQTDALNHPKTFHYTGPYRIMDTAVDEQGRTKSYDVDNLGRRTAEYVTGTDGVTIQETDFGYGDVSFPDVVTTRTVKKLNGPVWLTDLVTQYTLDAYGHTKDEIVDPNGLKLKTSHTYDLNGNKLSLTDPNGNLTGFQYDQRNRLTKVVYADGSAKTIDYYPNGLKWHESDENNHRTTFEYDALNRVTTQTRTVAAGNIVTRYGYDDAVQPKTSVQDANGHTTYFQYNGLLCLTKTTDALGNATTYDYSGPNSGAHAFDSSSFKPTTIKDPRGYVTTMTYDALYRATAKSVQYQIAPALYSNTITGYDNVGNPITVKDPVLNQTKTDFDALNRPTHVLYADGTQTFTTYTSTGLKWQVTDELGQTTETQYDPAGRAVAVVGPPVDDGLNPEQVDRTTHWKQPVTQTVYDSAGNVGATINPLLQRWDYSYDVRNRKIAELQPSVTDAVSGQVKRPTIYTGYDYVGNVLWVQDARGFTTETNYDEANRPLTVTAPPVLLAGGAQPVRPATTKSYDPAGNVLTVMDANHHLTTNTYDWLNRLQTTTDAVPITVTYGYDEVGNRILVQDGLNQQTTLAYDGLNRNTTTTDAAGKVTTLAYDGLNKFSRTDALGQETDYGYDARNRLLTVTYPARAVDNRRYGYDWTGHLLSVTEAGRNGLADVAYTYDALHRVLTETSNGATHTYRYDLAGNRLGVQYGLAGGGNGRLMVSSYDALNRLSTLTEGTRTTTYGYDLGGNVVTKTLPNGDAVETYYDGLGRAYEEEGSSVQGILYHYLSLGDAVGNLRSSTEYTAGVAPRKVSLSYDNADRLTSEAVTDLNSQVVSNTTYDYDLANNRGHKTANGVTATYTYNNLNQLTAWSDTAGHGASYGYDFNGNRVSRTVGGISDVYSYDTENRLTGLAKNTTEQASTTPGTYGYVYDYRTRRVTRTENNATTQMVFSGGTSVQEYSAPGVVSAEYVRGSDWGGGVGGVLYSLRGGSPSYDHYDRRGDVTARTNSTGTVTWQASYEAFGTRPAEYGTTKDRQKANTKEEDPTGLLNEGMRYRDLETGTFITRDPAGFIDGPNLYAYVQQNPWTKFDPEGLAESSTSGDGPVQQDGKAAHKEFQEVRGGKETQLESSGKKIRTDALVETENEVKVNELKPKTRLADPSKLKEAEKQLAKQMDGAEAGAAEKGKSVVGELWGWTKKEGRFVFEKIKGFRKTSDGVVKVAGDAAKSPIAKNVVSAGGEALGVVAVGQAVVETGQAMADVANKQVDQARNGWTEQQVQQNRGPVPIPELDRENEEALRAIRPAWNK